MNFVRYAGPFAPVFLEPVLPPELLTSLERAVLDGDLGYKFLSVARGAAGARPGLG